MEHTENKKKNLFGLSTLSVNNATTVFLLTLVILIFGVISYNDMPKEQFPEVSLPTIYINTPYFGNSAADIENLITRPIEKELQSISGVKNIRSSSVQDYSVITVEFEADKEIEDVLRKVKDGVDKAKSELPNDLTTDPLVLDINFSEIPIVTVNVSGDYSPEELRQYAEYLQDKIETIDEVARVELQGDQEREIKVDVDLMKMEAREVSFQDIENAISSENMTMSGGELLNNDFRRSIRVVGEFRSVREMQDLIIKSENQRPVYLRDIATVIYGFKEQTSIARSDKLPVISLNVIKRQGKNLLSAADKLKVEVDKAREVLPAGLKISLFNDQSVSTRDEVSNLENSIISGVILVVLVLLFFMGLRNALFVGMAIPLSMLLGVLFLYLGGVTLNIVVLFSLILALGMLVDNAIVVIENIYRYKQEGYSNTDAAKFGTGEVALPIISSTATTVAAFIPLAFWPGLFGQFMKYMPITLMLVLTASLFVALVINPVFTSRFMKLDERSDDPVVRRKRRNKVLMGASVMVAIGLLAAVFSVVWLRNLMIAGILITLVNFFLLRPASFFFQNRSLPVWERVYDKFIQFAMRRPLGIVLGTFVLMVLSIVLLGIRSPKVEFFPTAEPLYINVFVDLPLGKDIAATDRVINSMEDKILRILEPNKRIVEAVLTQIGENTSDPNSPPEPGVSPQKARITIAFVPTRERGGISTAKIMEEIRNEVQGIPGVAITVDKNADGPPAGKPINLEIQGEDVEKLVKLGNDVMGYINQRGIAGIEGLQADIRLGKPELVVQIDREAARRYELSTYSIASAIRTGVFGKEVSKFKVGEDEYPIFIRLDEKYRYDVNSLLNQRITFRNPANGRIVQVPISAVAKISYSTSYSAIKRKDLDRVVTIYSNVKDGYNANEIVGDIKAAMASYPMPSGYTLEFTGEQQQQAEDTQFLSVAFMVALFSIFLIIVAQFNSFSSPFIIILSVLFSTIGVFLGYVITGRDISVIFTGVGIISLAGVVVNNAIVLIDYTNLVIKRKLENFGLSHMRQLPDVEIKKAIEEGGATRLRPVLLTAITTVLGLIPLAIGFNIDFFSWIKEGDPKIFIGGDNTAIWGPMAWTVIYGLTFATFLTLVVVPSMYYLAYKLKDWLLSLLGNKVEKYVPAEEKLAE